MEKRINEFLKNFEWRWSLWQLLKGSGLVATFALPAWAAWAAQILVDYSPFSWVAAGFLGSLIASIMYLIVQFANKIRARAKWDLASLRAGDFVNPLSKIFQDKRIYLDRFVLPSHPFVENKTFIDCEIVGPANIYFSGSTQATENRYPIIDAVYIPDGKKFNNGFIFVNCMFRNCSFQRVTIFVDHHSYEPQRYHELLNWISLEPDDLHPSLLDFMEPDDPVQAERLTNPSGE